jgi:hypothetical protein
VWLRGGGYGSHRVGCWRSAGWTDNQRTGLYIERERGGSLYVPTYEELVWRRCDCCRHESRRDVDVSFRGERIRADVFTPKTPLCSCQSSIGRKKHLSAVVKVRYHIPCLDDCLTDLVHRRAVWICHGGDWGVWSRGEHAWSDWIGMDLGVSDTMS